MNWRQLGKENRTVANELFDSRRWRSASGRAYYAIYMRTKAQIDAILKDVRLRLKEKQRATGVRLRVPKDGYMEDDDWLNIIVSPVGKGLRAYQYVYALSEVQKELRARGTERVLLVPAITD